MITRDHPDDAQPLDDGQTPDEPDDAAYAARYQLPQLAAHAQAAEDNLVRAHLRAVGGHRTPPPASLLPGIYYDHPQTQSWRNSVGDPSAYGTTAAADIDGVELLDPRMFNPAPRQSFAVGTTTGESALGRPRPPLTPTRLRDSDYDDDEETAVASKIRCK